MCVRLAVASHALSVQGADWSPVPKYNASTIPTSLPRRFVHAEIQILVHYELASHQLTPRTIGVSKEACFLCDSFIRAHGRFAISGAHRHVVAGWTVPDLEEYTSQSVSQIRKALVSVVEDVMQEFLGSHQRHQWRPLPLQSAINLNVTRVSTPSMSTMATCDRTSREGLSITPNLMLPTSGSSTIEPDLQSVADAEVHVVETIAKSTSPLAEGKGNWVEEQGVDSCLTVNVEIDRSVSDHKNW